MKHNLSKWIHRSRKPVTIMFTDIVDSTRHWVSKGDVRGRMMIDQHNRLVFPVIKKFKGKVIKTIGDAVMASFSTPEDALLAGVGIQQALEMHRGKNKEFKLEVRIGIHTGKALVEDQDVFGDAVNVAARVEGQAGAGEVLISGSSEKQVKRAENFLTKKKSFIPKGKKTEIVVYSCAWRKMESQIEGINFNAILPMLSRQRTEMLVYLAAIFGGIYYVVHSYLRYLLADQENVYLMTFSPREILVSHPVVAAAMALGLIALLMAIRYLTVLPVFTFKLIKGGFGYALACGLALGIMSVLPEAYAYNSRDTYLQSEHLFVEVLQDEARIRQAPAFKAPVVTTARARDLYLLTDVREQGNATWNKVLLGVEAYGWIPRIVPASFGVAEQRLTSTNKFTLLYRDLYALAFGLLGFVWGFFSFAIKPL